MDIATITQLIGSVGFPIVCCIYLIHTNSKTIEDLRQTIENNTEVIIRLSSKLGVDNNEQV